jgi:hypothetical protein
MEAGIADHVWSLEELIAAALAAPEPTPLAPPEAPTTKPTAPSAPPGPAPRSIVLPGQLPFPGFL